MDITIHIPTLPFPPIFLVIGIIVITNLALAWRIFISNKRHPTNIFFALTALALIITIINPLTSLAQSTTETYQYSPVGRIIYKEGVGAYEYNDPRHPDAPSKAGDAAYTYDANGNRITETRNSETTTYSYDGENHLFSITNKNGTTSYLYDTLNGQRIQKILPNGTKITYHNNLSEVDQNGAYTDYIFLNDPINLNNQRVATIQNNQTFYNITDHLGSSSLTLDQNGIPVQKIDYFPFGAERLNIQNSSFNTTHTFTDKEKDPESGLIYFQARYYDPRIGLFIQQDPVIVAADMNDPRFMNAIMNPQLLNPYTYAGNNPMNNVDVKGESTERAWILKPVSTLAQTAFWKTVDISLRAIKGDKVSPTFLQHSLTINPNDIVATDSNKYGFIAQSVKDSPEYREYVGKVIGGAEQAGQVSIDKVMLNQPEKKSNSIVFEQGDLFRSIHGTYSTHIIGNKTSSGNWNLNVEITDVYDYKWQELKSNPSVMTWNNLAALSQKSETISPYKVTIKFNDTQKGKK